MPSVLQIFLMVDLFVIGMLVPEAIRHFHAHRKPAPHPEAAHDDAQLPAPVREHLVEEAAADYQKALESATAAFQHELTDTSSQISKQTKHLATEVISNELEQYRTELAKAREAAMS